MPVSEWLVAVSVFIIILFIAFGIGWWVRNHSNPNIPPTIYSAPTVWNKPTPSSNPAKNTCQLYQFPTAVVTINNVPTAVPGNPTFNPVTLDRLTGSNILPACIDSDQIIAQQVQHTCTAPFGVVDGAITRCFLINGGSTGIGGSESFYTNSACPTNTPECAGQLSLVSVNFQAPTVPNIFCIQAESANASVTMQSCNPSLESQLFRITRINPGQNPNSLIPGQNQTGLIAQILDRDNGLCLTPGNVTTTTIYDPNYIGLTGGCLGSIGCSGPTEGVTGTNVIMTTCTGGSSPGFVWALIPSITYCGVSGGCSGCTGCIGCTGIPGTNNCTGCVGCTGNHATITPPQIVYVGNLNIADIPIGPTGYQGITGSSAIFKWLLDNNAQSLYYGGGGNNLVLREMGTDVMICKEKPYSAQYINLTLYNTISKESVCLQECLTNCTGL